MRHVTDAEVAVELFVRPPPQPAPRRPMARQDRKPLRITPERERKHTPVRSNRGLQGFTHAQRNPRSTRSSSARTLTGTPVAVNRSRSAHARAHTADGRRAAFRRRRPASDLSGYRPSRANRKEQGR
jgi:hypothetical protein